MENQAEFLASWSKDPKVGQFVVFSEYRDGHGGGTATVVDLISVSDDNLEEEEGVVEGNPADGLYRTIAGWCDSTMYDGYVCFEVWPNGEVYLGGDGIGHPRYRVTGMLPALVPTTLDDSGELTDAHGFPVWWWLEQFEQDSWPDKEGTRVEMGIWYHLCSIIPGWEFRKAFAKDQQEVDSLVAVATEEFVKPKYGRIPRAIRVGGKVAWSRFAEHMPKGHELKDKEERRGK